MNDLWIHMNIWTDELMNIWTHMNDLARRNHRVVKHTKYNFGREAAQWI